MQWMSDGVVAEAKEANRNGESQRAIARRLGVAHSTVFKWLHNRTRTRPVKNLRGKEQEIKS
jgi:transposase-like protein